jgi:putative FmdB family regulatory protein
VLSLIRQTDVSLLRYPELENFIEVRRLCSTNNWNPHQTLILREDAQYAQSPLRPLTAVWHNERVMPLYEYVCDQCDTQFEELRPSSRMNEPASCPSGHDRSRRILSRFAAMTRDSYGEASAVGGAGCGGCGGGCTNCACAG